MVLYKNMYIRKQTAIIKDLKIYMLFTKLDYNSF